MTRIIGWAVRLAIVGLVVGATILSTTSPLGPVGLVALPYLGVGALLVIRRPETSIGWILVGLGACYTLLSTPVTAHAQQFADGTVDLPVLLFAIVHSGLGTTMFFLYAVLVIVFPSGRLPVGRWGRLGRAGLGAGLVFAASVYVMPGMSVGYPVSASARNPIALLPELAIWQVVTPSTAIFPVMIVVAAGAISLVIRARHATGVERQQLRWIALSFGMVMSAVVCGLVIATLVPSAGQSGLAWIPAIFAFPLPPIAIGIAVLRYRLYDIDRIISRTISYGVVSAMLVAVYAGLILVLQGPLGAITGGETVAVAASTLVAAALFQPIRRRTQTAVDRRFDRARYDAQRTVEGFAANLRDEFDLERLGGELGAVVGQALAPTSVDVWLRPSLRIPGR